jgi:hypothetical protein
VRGPCVSQVGLHAACHASRTPLHRLLACKRLGTPPLHARALTPPLACTPPPHARALTPPVRCRYALSLANPFLNRVMEVGHTKLRVTFTPAAMELPCGGGTIRVAPVELLLHHQSPALRQLLEGLRLGVLTHSGEDGQIMSCWLSQQAWRVEEWSIVDVTRQDMFIRECCCCCCYCCCCCMHLLPLLPRHCCCPGTAQVGVNEWSCCRVARHAVLHTAGGCRDARRA